MFWKRNQFVKSSLVLGDILCMITCDFTYWKLLIQHINVWDNLFRLIYVGLFVGRVRYGVLNLVLYRNINLWVFCYLVESLQESWEPRICCPSHCLTHYSSQTDGRFLYHESGGNFWGHLRKALSFKIKWRQLIFLSLQYFVTCSLCK